MADFTLSAGLVAVATVIGKKPDFSGMAEATGAGAVRPVLSAATRAFSGMPAKLHEATSAAAGSMGTRRAGNTPFKKVQIPETAMSFPCRFGVRLVSTASRSMFTSPKVKHKLTVNRCRLNNR